MEQVREGIEQGRVELVHAYVHNMSAVRDSSVDKVRWSVQSSGLRAKCLWLRVQNLGFGQRASPPWTCPSAGSGLRWIDSEFVLDRECGFSSAEFCTKVR